MKLILTNEVTGLGAPGDVVEVKDGYGRNYLIPRGYAMRWTRGAERQIEAIRKAREIREIRDVDTARQVADELSDLRVRLSVRAGESGRLFGAVTADKIVQAVKEAGGPELDKRRIEIRNPIKSLGSHRVDLRLHADVSTGIDVEVVPESQKTR